MKLRLWTLCRTMQALVVVILVHVSQHALAVVVQAYEGMEAVLLPCQYSGAFPEAPSVVWTRSGLHPTVIHLLHYKSDRLKEERRFGRRTAMKTTRLESGDLSLILREPQPSDNNNYTCSIRWETQREGTKERTLTQVQLQVKGDQEVVKVQRWAESAQLRCKASVHLSEDATVQWTHFDPQQRVVHEYRNGTDDRQKQDKFFCSRTEMKEDMSLVLKYPRDNDGGMYICTVERGGDVLRSKVLLQLVKEGLPVWAVGVLVLLGVVLTPVIVVGAVTFHRLSQNLQTGRGVVSQDE